MAYGKNEKILFSPKGLEGYGWLPPFSAFFFEINKRLPTKKEINHLQAESVKISMLAYSDFFQLLFSFLTDRQ